MAFSGSDQRLGVLVIGARQWNHNAAGTPAGELARAHSIGGDLGQRFYHGQPTGDPAWMPAHFSCNLLLAKLVDCLQIAKQGGLLKNIELTGTVSGQQTTQRILRIAGHNLGLKGVQTGPGGSRNPQITVNKNKTRMLCGHHYDGNKLPVAHQ